MSDNNTSTEIPLGFLASRILDTPLMITRAKLDQILDVVGGRIGLNKTITVIQPSAEVLNAQASRRSDIKVSRGVARIPIYGTLAHRTQGLSALSGMTSYSDIRTQFNDALTNPDVDSILLEIDSPGGEVAGVFDLVDTIYSARGTKPIVAMINERGYSAAYAIASAADTIYLSRTAGVGSIGVIMLHVDRSEANKKAGLTYTPIYAGERKIDGSPHAPLSEKARATAQAIVSNMYDLFVSTSARNLGLSESIIRSTQAGTYHGQAAVDIGLAHAVLSYQEVINQLANQKGGTRPMATEKEIQEAKDQAAKEAEIQAALEVAKKEKAAADAAPPAGPTTAPTVTITDQALIKARVDAAITSERERCTSILEACSVSDTNDLSLDMINDGSTIETTHKMIMTVLAERSKATSVTSAVNPARSGETNPVLKEAQRRADAINKQ